MLIVFRTTTCGIDGVVVGVGVLVGVEDCVAVGIIVEAAKGVGVVLGLTAVVGDGMGVGSGA